MSSDDHIESYAPPPTRPTGWISVLLVNMLILYGLLAWWFSLPFWLSRSRVSIGTVTNRSVEGFVELAVIGVALYALYAVGAIVLWSSDVTATDRRLIVGGGIVAGAILLWTYPVTSTDVFDYFFRSRMTLLYGANPYLALPNQFTADPYLRYIGWPNAPSAYGPLWEILSLALVKLGGDALLPSLLLYKALALVTHLLSGWLISVLVENERLKIVGVYAWLWSPLALWELIGIGHNDGLLILSLLLALWAVQRDRHWLAVLALVAGALLKFLPAIFLPLVVLDWLRRRPGLRQRFTVIAATLALTILPTVVFYAPYWALPADFRQLGLSVQFDAIWQGRTPTLRNLAVREGFLNAAPLAVISYLLQTAPSVHTINRVLGTLGVAATSDKGVRSLISSLGTLLLGAGVVWQSWHVWFRRRALQPTFFGLLLWYILAGSQWFQAWYVLWPLAIFAARPRRTAFAWLTVWALTAQASYLLQYIVLPNIKLSGQTLQAQVAYLLLIYPLPLLVWLLMRYARAGRQSSRKRALVSTP